MENREFDFTRMLENAQVGDQDAKNELFDLIDADLRETASQLVRRKGPFAQATSLVNEAYLRLFKEGRQLDLKNRRYFFTAVIDQMTKVLDERIRSASKRPAATPLDQFADQAIATFNETGPFAYQEMRSALMRLKRSRNAKKARRHALLELHYFGGLTVKDAAELLDLSYSQARDDKRLADAELYQAIKSRQT